MDLSESPDSTLSLPPSLKLSYESPSLPDHNYYSCSPHSEQHSPSLAPRPSSPVSDRSTSPAEEPTTEVTSTSHRLPCSHEFLALVGSPGEGPSLGYRPSLPSPYPPPPTTSPNLLSCPSPPPMKASLTPNLPPPAHSGPSPPSSPPPPRRAWSSPSSSYYFVDFPGGSGGNSPLFPIDLSVSGEGSSRPAFSRKPFYSLSPKTPKVEPEGSPPSSPYSPPPSSQSSPIEEDPTPSSSSSSSRVVSSSPSSTSAPEEVVVEVVEGGTGARSIEPPCIVDLTNEDDDDDDDEVEIVADDQPVVFLGSEASTRRRKRRRRHEPRPSSAAEELIVINDSTPQRPTPPSQVDSDPDPTSGANSQWVSVGSDPSPTTPGANPQLFGDLNPLQVIAVERENPPAPTPTSDVDVGFAAILPQLGLYNLQSRLNSRAQNSSERPRPPNLRSLIEAPIPPDVFEDIVSLEAERRPGSGIVPSRLQGWPIRLDESVQRAPTLGRSATVTTAGALRLLFSSSPSHAPSASQVPSRPPRPSSGDGSGDLSCPICFESFKELKRDGKSISSTVCGHIFCTQCLEDHFKRAKQCPTCRQRLTKKQYHRLFI